MRKINEIFYSLQGEGYHVGIPATFVRFSGCNLKCVFCDTLHENGEMMTDAQILQKIGEYPTNHIILTGGEPSLFIDEEFVNLLKFNGYTVHIETNGTHALPANIDWITFSPKNDDFVLKHVNELKVIYTGQDLTKWSDFDAVHKYLQPCTMPTEEETKKSIARTVEYIKSHPEWRLSVQLHKLIQIP